MTELDLNKKAFAGMRQVFTKTAWRKLAGPWTVFVFVVAFLLVCSAYCDASTPSVAGIAHVAFRVNNLASERSFFQKLGFEEAFVLPNDQNPAEVFVKVNDDQFIELYPRGDASQTLGWMHVCYKSESLKELNAAYLERHLDPSQGTKGGAGNLMFSLRDPEGRVVEFTQYLPGSRHFLDHGKHLGDSRISDELQGIKMPVLDVAAARRFYISGLGFQEQGGYGEKSLRISSSGDQYIELASVGTGVQPEFIFRVANVAKTARQLRSRGFTVRQRKRLALVQDPNGNTFAFAAGWTR